ncbi:hypothetical protein GOL81_23105 [Sinorhizobium medicae]|uniref:helix-turn-helix domain-containing protein n=1 Tax=Sinorhizobium medicae TaxID=110321 RepID=UPI000C7D072A|nr:helix-turn-helix domain-containing protein [Sinorhizobium medicae]MDX0568138.1 hypothetical protein [Sinorhizobium medicae]MDX0580764.1 hypothetical protein [Sinorhizobium medicae]MDX0784373.1 hypothetical protein [Sinorhizobium medicae]MDX0893663.1 hypothetical protein [Sinorhizobium medicae]MDX0935341.1 hypothetical protein [Sinorhizobium medicae]
MSTKSAIETFRALAIGSKLWFRQKDTERYMGEKPVAAIKVNLHDVLIVGAQFGWALHQSDIYSPVTEEMLSGATKDASGDYLGWGIFDNDLQVWTTDPTVKRARVKKVRPSLIGQRFTIMSLPEGADPAIKVGMRGTMVQTGMETPLVVLDGYHRTTYIHVSHLCIHKRRPKITMDRLPPQTKQVLDLLKAKGSLTAIEAGGVLRARSLAKRISELKEAGVAIIAENKLDHTGQRYARYHLKAAA